MKSIMHFDRIILYGIINTLFDWFSPKEGYVA